MLSDFVLFAQEPGDDDGTGGLEGVDPPAAPINSKLVFLAILGLIFVFYTIKNKRKIA
jgi:hypothetical protein